MSAAGRCSPRARPTPARLAAVGSPPRQDARCASRHVFTHHNPQHNRERFTICDMNTCVVDAYTQQSRQSWCQCQLLSAVRLQHLLLGDGRKPARAPRRQRRPRAHRVRRGAHRAMCRASEAGVRRARQHPHLLVLDAEGVLPLGKPLSLHGAVSGAPPRSDHLRGHAVRRQR